jgi:serine phosphatase RsbU (regulator of sigma subunit)
MNLDVVARSRLQFAVAVMFHWAADEGVACVGPPHVTGYVVDGRGAVKTALPSTGLPLGVLPDGDFPVGASIALEDGDRVLLFTDGLVEAPSPDGGAFGTERILSLVGCYREDSAQQLVSNLYHAARAFSQGQPQLDDMTVAIIRVEPER